MDRLTDKQRKYIQKIFDEMQEVLFGIAMKYLKNEDFAWDAIQETYLTLCKKVDKLMESSNPQGYVINTLMNKVHNGITEIIKTNQRFVYQIHNDDKENTEPIVEQIPDETSYFVDIEYSDAVKAEDYELLKLVDIEGYTIAEAANKMGMNVEKCKKRLQRARKRMKDAIE